VCLLSLPLPHRWALKGIHKLHGRSLLMLLAWGAPSSSRCVYIPSRCNALLGSRLGGFPLEGLMLAA
jgi:hypothetical protein